MSDDERESDTVGPDIDLEKIAGEEGANQADDDADQTSREGLDGEELGHEGDETHGHDAHDHDSEPAGRTTAPQSDFTTKQAMIGALVTAVGIVIAYGIPAALA